MTTDLTIVQVQNRATLAAQQAQQTKIVTKQDYESAGELVLLLGELEKQANSLCDPVVKATNEAHKAAVKQKADIVTPVISAKRWLKGLMDQWREDQKTQATIAQSQAQVQVATKHQDVILNQAIAAEAMGDSKTAQAILNRPSSPPAVIIQPDIPKTGVVFQEIWVPEIVDASLVPREYLMLDMPKIRKVVSALKGQTNIAGIRAVSKRAGC